MGSLSVSTHRGHAHWKGLLLVVSLLNFWSLHATVHENISVKNAAEGEDVLLRILNKPPDATHLAWYRGKDPDEDYIIAFIADTAKYQVRCPLNGPVAINSDGSLLLKKVTVMDSGIYTVTMEEQNFKILLGYKELRVYRRVKVPTLRASNTTVTENKDAVVLTCYSTAHTIQWLFNGAELQPTERMKLSKDNRRITINPIKREDAGKYQCKASNPISSAASVALKLNVKFE